MQESFNWGCGISLGAKGIYYSDIFNNIDLLF